MKRIDIRKMQLAESSEVSELMLEVFISFQGPTTSEAGMSTFASEFSHEKIAERLKAGNLFLVAHCDDNIVGMIAVRDSSHVFGLYVRPEYQGQGIASRLWHEAFKLSSTNPKDNVYTVNASEYALPVYKKWGFQATDVKQKRNGIVFIPMRLCLRR